MQKNIFLWRFFYKNSSIYSYFKKILAFCLSIFIVVTSVGIAPISTFAQTQVATHFEIELPHTIKTNQPIDVTVKAVNASGNVDTNYRGSIVFISEWINDVVPMPGRSILFTAEDQWVKKFSKGVIFKKVWKNKLSVQDLDNDISWEVEAVVQEVWNATTFNVWVNHPVLNEKTNLFVSAIDDQWHVDDNFVGKVKIKSLNPEDASIIPETTVNFTQSDRGVKKVFENVIFTSTGTHSIQVSTLDDTIKATKEIKIRDISVWKNSHFDISVPENIKIFQNVPITVRALDENNHIVDNRYAHHITITIDQLDWHDYIPVITPTPRYYSMSGGEKSFSGFFFRQPWKYMIRVDNGNDGIIQPDEFGIQPWQPFIFTKPKTIIINVEGINFVSTPLQSHSLNSPNSGPGGSISNNNHLNADIWKLVHCEIAKEGFVWNKPTSDYVTRDQCSQVNVHIHQPLGGIIDKILDTIKKNTTVSKEEKKEKRFLLEEYYEMLKLFNETIPLVLREDNLFEQVNILEKYENFLKAHKDIPNNAQNTILAIMQKFQMSQTLLKKILERKQYIELQKIYEKFEKTNEWEVAFISSPYITENTIFVAKEGLLNSWNDIIYPLIMYDKNGKMLKSTDFTIELQNAPKGIELKNNIVNSQLGISEKILRENKITSQSFNILIKNKNTGRVFVKTYKIQSRDTLDTKNVYEFTPTQVSENFKNFI